MHYRLSADPLLPHYIAVEAQLDKLTPGERVELQLPAWRPGRYELQSFAKNIQRFSITDETGQSVPFRKITKDRWRIEPGTAQSLLIRYNYYALLPTAYQLNAGSSFINESLLYVNPVNLCLYAEGRINEPCSLTLAIPAYWTVACGMPRRDATSVVLEARDFYELVDCPLIAAPSLQQHSYTIGETRFHVWLQGGRRSDGGLTFDPERLVHDFTRFSAAQLALFGEFPEADYHFLTLILPVAYYHGVEHRNSTVLVLGPNDEGEGLYQDLLGVSSHELFHAWNIIRIRPAELLPYDFTKENYFQTCFVAEGVTTYYGDLMLRRSGVFNDEAYLKELQVLFKRHFDLSGHAFQSLTESSWDLWLDGYEKGVPERKVSVYHKGAIAALLLDLRIRQKTAHARSLDDVMRLLWERHGRPFIGYTLADYRAITEEVAGEPLADYFDRFITGNEYLLAPLNEALAWVGLQVVDETSTLDHPGGIRLLELGDEAGRAERARWFGQALTELDHTVLIDEQKDGTSVSAK